MGGEIPPSPTSYRVDGYLAQGGMGSLYVGKKLGPKGFERPVVLKQLRSDLVADPVFCELFVREAKLSAALDHVNIVRTLDLIKLGRSFYMVMEYVSGADLRTLLRRIRLRRERLHPAAVTHVGLELLAALDYAHSRTDSSGRPLGIVHRDLSPSNILISQTGEVKLLDFGIAITSALPGNETRGARPRVRGTAGYMAPEQAEGRATDGRSDIYSLAVSLFEALTGERLFDRAEDARSPGCSSAEAIMEALAGVPPGLQVALQRALARDPVARFPNAFAFATALRTVALRERMNWSGAMLARHLEEVAGPAACWRDHYVTASGTSTATVTTGERASADDDDDDDLVELEADELEDDLEVEGWAGVRW